MLAQAAPSTWHYHQLSLQAATESQGACLRKLRNRTFLAARAAGQTSSDFWLQASQRLPSDQLGFSQSEPETITLLTKARKATKPTFSAKPEPSRLARIGKAAGYAAMAVGAGAAINALASDASQLVVASAALAAGENCYVLDKFEYDLICMHMSGSGCMSSR